MSFADLLPAEGEWKAQLVRFVQEDIPSFDYGGFVVGSNEKSGTLWMKSDGVVAGVVFAKEVFKMFNLNVEWNYDDGAHLKPSTVDGGKICVAKVRGSAKDILQAERLVLNILARLSGVASQTKLVVDAARTAGYNGIIAGTRKTTPGLRIMEKYAMLVGGADSHRYDLSSMIMLKDNHIWATGSITKAVESARKVGGFSIKIEVECGSYEEACEACDAGADVVMLDNFSGEDLKIVAAKLKEQYKNVLLECSGGLRLDNLGGYLCNAVDIYSTSSIHQGTGIVDFSLKIDH
ncbi:nicotinate-nucleotide diphosphorylase (carboxylating) [Martiniozyma asiatica (nom. inval.)]|nr:nicotinate-nucleotide diphosphorylase (carboxylating) [Martiniozyma asiatica]